jgi:hypothetical protein
MKERPKLYSTEQQTREAKEWNCVRPFYRDEDWRLEYWNIEDREAGNMIIHWDPRSLYSVHIVCEQKTSRHTDKK